ncbi:unnamed protein product, partial [Prorocentrum cordatum]
PPWLGALRPPARARAPSFGRPPRGHPRRLPPMSLLPGQAPTKKLRLDEALKPAGYEGGVGRGAKVPMQTRADMGFGGAVPPKRGTDAMFGNAPPGYVPGRGRGATGFIGGVSRDEVDRDDDKAPPAQKKGAILLPGSTTSALVRALSLPYMARFCHRLLCDAAVMRNYWASSRT